MYYVVTMYDRAGYPYAAEISAGHMASFFDRGYLTLSHILAGPFTSEFQAWRAACHLECTMQVCDHAC